MTRTITPQTLLVLSHPTCRRHRMGPDHVERPERLAAIEALLGQERWQSRIERRCARLISGERLASCHTREYVDLVFRSEPPAGLDWLDPDTAMGPGSLEAARRAAGAAIDAVDAVLDGRARNAFCAVRPPGHHAERARAMGFCLFGNVALAAVHALEQHGLDRVAIVDFDVHHGNGTEDIVRDDPRILFCSSFQHPFYPGSGADTVSDHIRNLPLPAGTDGPSYREAVKAAWLDDLAEFEPQLLFFSAGFDAHRDDPMADLRLLEEDFAWVTRSVIEATLATTGGRVISVLEGGYSLEALVSSLDAHLGALLEA